MHLSPAQLYDRVRDALDWRIRRLIGDQAMERIIVDTARRWRRLLRRAVFVGVAGSVGKTTTKELLLGMLSRKGRGLGNGNSYCNSEAMIARTMLRLRPTHDLFAAELSESHPGCMDGQLALLRPNIGIVTVIGTDHWSAFHSRDAIAAEVSKLVACLPPTGTAVLNADDERVLAMARSCAARVITYGTSATADLRAEDIRSVWPDRLQFTLVRNAERVKVSTQLCGTHWIPSVLGAIGGGIAAGMSLAECAEGIAVVAPFEGRMQPVTTPEGVTFIRDDFKATVGTLDASFEFMRAAQAKRKVIVIGELSDVGSSKELKYARAARSAQEIADLTIFAGPWSSSALKARRPGREDAVRIFNHVRDAAAHLNSITTAGDLVLLKGSNRQNHLSRIILARSGDVACWRDDCRLISFCYECPRRTTPSGPPVFPQGGVISDALPATTPADRRAIDPGEQVVVGLGNPQAARAGTPHNVGYAVVDRLADSLGLTWETHADAWLARGTAHGQNLCLVKMRVSMNLIGPALKQLASALSFKADQCILVHDDLDLPLGTVRTRMHGGAGGHRGIASILEAFQSDRFRRVKVGVGHPAAKLNRVQYVLTPLDPASRAAIDPALATAQTHVLELVTLTASPVVSRLASLPDATGP